jgi:Co/Zn/Cd efflux system component
MPINRTRKVFRKRRDFHWSFCVYLLPGPLTLEEIKANYQQAPFPLSQQPDFYMEGGWNKRGLERLPDDLAGLIKAGWVIQEGDRYALTEYGRLQVGRILEDASSSTEWIIHRLRSLIQPEAASKVTLIVQIILALIKLPAGLLSGSVGLINDSADTILDLFSSLLVYLGIRFDKERLVSTLLVVFMLGTGSFTLYEAMERVITPDVPKVDWFPFAAAILSAMAGLFLWTYQRYVGIHSGLMTFIAESVDSRNHVIVALSVIAGLAASLLRFGLLDTLVGLVVAILILWSAIQLVVDLLRSSADEKVDLSHYGFWLLNAYEHFRDSHLREWMLYLVDQREVQTRGE